MKNQPHLWQVEIKFWADGFQLQWKHAGPDEVWEDQPIGEVPEFNATNVKWRVKPDTKRMGFRLALMKDGSEMRYLEAVESDKAIENMEKNACFIKWLKKYEDLGEIEV